MKGLTSLLVLVYMRIVAPQSFLNDIEDFKYKCAENTFDITITTKYPFNGRIYPVNMDSNPCAKSYHKEGTTITYQLTLTGCNTMFSNIESGVEYFNELYIQMHESLLTVNDESHKIHCIYSGRDRVSLPANHFMIHTQYTPITSPLASEIPCTIEIFKGSNNFGGDRAEMVKLGEKLTLLVSCNDPGEESLGMKVTNCVVSDGLDLESQELYDHNGCAVDSQLIGDLYYNKQLTRAYSVFKAHKFPYSPSVYYKCDIELCNKKAGECQHIPPKCNLIRQRRQVDNNGTVTILAPSDSTSAQNKTIVQVGTSMGVDDNSANLNPTNTKVKKEDQICLDKVGFAIGIAVAAFLLLLAIIILIILLMWRRRRRIDKDGMSDTMSAYTDPRTGYASSRGYSN